MFWFAYGGPENDEYFGESAAATDSQIRFCITNFLIGLGAVVPAFTYEDENVSEAACTGSASNRWVTTRKVDTWIDGTANFTGQW